MAATARGAPTLTLRAFGPFRKKLLTRDTGITKPALFDLLIRTLLPLAALILPFPLPFPLPFSFLAAFGDADMMDR